MGVGTPFCGQIPPPSHYSNPRATVRLPTCGRLFAFDRAGDRSPSTARANGRLRFAGRIVALRDEGKCSHSGPRANSRPTMCGRLELCQNPDNYRSRRPLAPQLSPMRTKRWAEGGGMLGGRSRPVEEKLRRAYGIVVLASKGFVPFRSLSRSSYSCCFTPPSPNIRPQRRRQLFALTDEGNYSPSTARATIRPERRRQLFALSNQGNYSPFRLRALARKG